MLLPRRYQHDYIDWFIGITIGTLAGAIVGTFIGGSILEAGVFCWDNHALVQLEYCMRASSYIYKDLVATRSINAFLRAKYYISQHLTETHRYPPYWNPSTLLGRASADRPMRSLARSETHMGFRGGCRSDVVELLIGKSVETGVGDKDGWVPLYLEAERAHKDMVERVKGRRMRERSRK